MKIRIVNGMVEDFDVDEICSALATLHPGKVPPSDVLEWSKVGLASAGGAELVGVYWGLFAAAVPNIICGKRRRVVTVTPCSWTTIMTSHR